MDNPFFLRYFLCTFFLLSFLSHVCNHDLIDEVLQAKVNNINRKPDYKQVKIDAENIRAEVNWDGTNSETFDRWTYVKDDVRDDDCDGEMEGDEDDDEDEDGSEGSEGSGDENDVDEKDEEDDEKDEDDEDMEDADDKLPFKVFKYNYVVLIRKDSDMFL